MARVRRTMVADLAVLVLAGGKGTRMKSAKPKPLHQIVGLPILAHILKTADSLKPAAIVVLCGYQANIFQKHVQESISTWGIKAPIKFALQKNLNGSGSAVKSALSSLKGYKNVLILSGDAPLIKKETLQKLITQHKRNKAISTVLTVEIANPKGYGRVVKNAQNNLECIVEETETDESTSKIKEINSGIYLFDIKELSLSLKELKPQGPKKEYYLTDTLAILKQKGLKTEVFKAEDYTEAMGINSKKQLSEAAEIMRARINDNLMARGVTFINPKETYIDDTVQIGEDTIVYPNCFISGETIIGKNCIIGPNSWIENSIIEDDVNIKTGCYIIESKISQKVQIGPYAHLRPQTILKENVKVGNFVEIKKSVIGVGSKVPHLTYIGDTQMGANVNVGAGSITCNYDGTNKHQTIIGDKVFVGSNTNFVAPVKIASGARIGAGSTITEDIPANTLSIARARQVNIKIKKEKKNE